MANGTHTGVLLTVRFKSSLAPDELEKRYKERLPDFRALPGLLQKYYLHDPSSNEWGGFYFWDSQESLDEYMESDLRKSIPEVYQIVGTPRIEKTNVIDILRPERV
jgi:heme-degrading monooxygenase HmoA